MEPGDIITGKILRSHYCAAGWRNHQSTVDVEVISPKMGVIVDSDGGGNIKRSGRQSYYVYGEIRREIGTKIRLSSLYVKRNGTEHIL